jgi:hypothetical protein
MRIVIAVFIFLNLTACKNSITIHFKYHWPYCGGKMPDSSEINGHFENAQFHSFLLVANKDKARLIATDENGMCKMRIKPNKAFSIFDIDKNQGYDELKRLYPLLDSNYYRYLSEKEWQAWKEIPDFKTIGITKESKRNGMVDTIDVVMKKTCFTGTNPIILYIGPNPR